MPARHALQCDGVAGSGGGSSPGTGKPALHTRHSPCAYYIPWDRTTIGSVLSAWAIQWII